MMKKTLVILAMVLVSTSVFADKHRDNDHWDNDNHDRDIHGRAFKGNTKLPPVTPGSGSASNNGDNHASDNGNANGVGHQLPSVPVPSAMWLFGSALVGFLTFTRSRKK